MHIPYAAHTALCRRYRGARIDDIEFREHADALDWSDVWPVIDADLCLVGIVTDSTVDGYLNWRDEAMISLSDVMDGGWLINVPEDGYATQPRGGR
jgi:hypothetical protein